MNTIVVYQQGDVVLSKLKSLDVVGIRIVFSWTLWLLWYHTPDSLSPLN